nr:MAG TPA: hypothetical protein [Caudoviricetes sp.]DAO89752.1 MAG TPA: hypothetical protein [Caudoviricetes sp.]
MITQNTRPTIMAILALSNIRKYSTPTLSVLKSTRKGTTLSPAGKAVPDRFHYVLATRRRFVHEGSPSPFWFISV